MVSVPSLLSVSCELVLKLALAPSWVHVYGTLAEAKMCTFTLESTHFIFNMCPIYPHDGASAKFRTNSQETHYSVEKNFQTPAASEQTYEMF